LNDPNIPTIAKAEVKGWKKKNPQSIPELYVCQDVINADKHLLIIQYSPATKDVSSLQGYGVGRYGKGGYGFGEYQITITMQDGTVFNALHVAEAVVKCWDGFFARHGL
jgi:hypothetical protein